MKREDTIVVIGSGPGGDIRGADIDRYPVVRMWNHTWQPVDRYGSRYSYGLITTTDDARLASRRPKYAWLFYNVPHEKPIVASINEKPIVVLKHADWYRRADAHGAKPAMSNRALKFTRGFAAVAGAINLLRPRRIIVIGMNILRDGFTGSRYFDPAALPFYVNAYPGMTRIPNWATDTMPAGVRGEGPHDYSAESAIVREMAAEAGTEIVWE